MSQLAPGIIANAVGRFRGMAGAATATALPAAGVVAMAQAMSVNAVASA